MTTTPTMVEVNCTTGEVTERPFTAEELETREQARIDFEAKKAQEEAEAQAIAELKASAKIKLVAGEPLTEEEASVLLI